MPFPVLAAMAVVSIATTMYGAKKSADAQRAAGTAGLLQGEYNRRMAEYNGEKIREQSRAKADKIFEHAARLRSQQIAQQAGSGVVIGEGSAAAVTEDTRNLASEDALVALYAGIEGEQAELYEGDMNLLAAENQYRSRNDAADAAIISGVGQAASQAASTYYTHQTLKAK